MRTLRNSVPMAIAALTVSACSAPRPVLYPNAQLTKVGDAAAQHDIDDCMQRASQYVSSGAHVPQVAKTTGAGAAGGAAVGAVGGAITGNPGEGAAVGAATGATAGLLGGLFSSGGSSAPDPVYAAFVDRCLRERGYDPIGWH